jgi:outer membrane usher protein
MTQPVGESYALIRVPGVPGVTGLSSNQPIARTNRRGELIVPNLMPYYGNKLGIVDQDLPLDYEIQSTEKTIAPPYRGGAVVTFPAMRMRSVRGSVELELAGETVPAAYGNLTVVVHGHRYESPLGASGEFDLQNLPGGRYTGTVESASGACSLAINVPGGDQPIVSLGTLRCIAMERP